MRRIAVGFLVTAILFLSACGNGESGNRGTDGPTSGDSGSAGSTGIAGSMTGSGGSSGTGDTASSGGGSGGSATGDAGIGGPAGGSGGMTGGGPNGHFYVAPNGTGSACTQAAPCSIGQAKTLVQGAAQSMQSDLVVELADGKYTLDETLVYRAADSGANGHTVIWQATDGAQPILSGATKITGWTVSDATKNIWKAAAPGSFATRQLFVDGKLATRARQVISRSSMTFTDTGFKYSNLGLDLNAIVHPERTDLHAVGSFTDRYSPVQSIANDTATMVQPAWQNNNWGYDTIQKSYRPSTVWLENAYEFIDQPGEWYLDTTAGALYYKPLVGQDMGHADVELPHLEVLMVVGGTYDQPAHDLAFRGLTFSDTSWLGPNSKDGYASQQTGGFIAGSGYPEFEATRPKWHQMPAAVQVSAAKNVSFLRDRFVALGEVGLGIGNDDNAHLTKVGLGADTITVTGCIFSQIAAGAIAIGGIQENAHHPSDPRMIDQNMTISDNLVHDIGIDYRDAAGVLFTYTKKVVVAHNEIYDIPYSGINSGYGWGSNDAGGSDDYANRNLYKYQPRYTTATTAQDNQITANLLHDGMQQMNDGGCHYNLSANPGTVVSQNYCKGPWPGSSYGDYEDEGSRYLTITKNIFSGWNTWVIANGGATKHTGDLTVTNNWVTSKSANPSLRGSGNMVSGNTTVSLSSLPSDARAVANAAGLEPAYADLKSP